MIKIGFADYGLTISCICANTVETYFVGIMKQVAPTINALMASKIIFAAYG